MWVDGGLFYIIVGEIIFSECESLKLLDWWGVE